jgi:SulP family sulfate permease
MSSHKLTKFIPQKISLNQILPDLTAGMVAGTFVVIYSISYAALIFAGQLSPSISAGLGLLLLNGIIINVVLASFSSYPAALATPQKTTAAVLALVASTIATTIPTATPETKFLTIAAVIILNSVLSGLFFIGLGWFKLGGLIRFIPYPVIGGFLAGSGVLLVQGAMRMLTGIAPELAQMPKLFQPTALTQWVLGLGFAILVLFMTKRFRHFLVLPGVVAGAIALFYIVLTLSGTSVAEASSQGLFLGPFSGGGGLFNLATIPALHQANWSLVFSQIPSLAAIWLIDGIGLLMNASGVELAVSKDMDLNHELKVVGLGTFASGLAGGIGGFHSMSQSVLVHRLGGTSRLVGWVAAGICAIVLLAGASALSFFPKLIVGGLLLYLGLEFLYDWLYLAWFRLSLADYLIVVLIVIVIAATGYLQGIGVGLIATTLLFVINYSRLSVTKRVASGAYYHSNVLRTSEEANILREEGERIYILELQGLIFFGTANKLLNQVRDHINHSTHNPLKFVVLNFRLVSGLDASAAISFAKLKQVTQRKQIHLLFTNLSLEAMQRLTQGGCLAAGDPLCHIFADLDRGLEWCELQILEGNPMHQQESASSLAKHLEASFFSAEQIARLMTYLQPRSLVEGESLFRQGDSFDGLYFVGLGQVSVVLELGEGQTKRLRTYTIGNTIGEMGLYRKAPRMASVVADKPSEMYFLSTEAFEQMETEEPKLSASFHRFIVNLLAERLSHREEELKHLLQ